MYAPWRWKSHSVLWGGRRGVSAEEERPTMTTFLSLNGSTLVSHQDWFCCEWHNVPSSLSATVWYLRHVFKLWWSGSPSISISKRYPLLSFVRIARWTEAVIEAAPIWNCESVFSADQIQAWEALLSKHSTGAWQRQAASILLEGKRRRVRCKPTPTCVFCSKQVTSGRSSDLVIVCRRRP